MKSLGIDLAGMEKNPTGVCTLTYSIQPDVPKVAKTHVAYTDGDIIAAVKEEAPDVVCIDGPLSKPNEGFSRQCDQQLASYGIVPPLLGSMRTVMERGMRLKAELSGFKVIEVFSVGTAKILGYYDRDQMKQQKRLLSLGVRGDLETRYLTKDEVDAVSAALTGYLYLTRKTTEVGSEDGKIVVPKV